MGKISQQMFLLTRKNLNIRFSHRCLSFWELGLPLILTAILGILISYIGISSPSRENDDWYSNSNRQQNETRHDFINRPENMKLVRNLNVHYLTADKVSNETERLMEEIMKTVLKADNTTTTSSSKYGDTMQLNWKRNWRTEKQLEICLLKWDPKCLEIYAAVVFTKIQDAVQQHNKFLIEYKIRMIPAQHMYSFRAFDVNRVYVNNDFSINDTIVDGLGRDYFCAQYSQWNYGMNDCTGMEFVFIQAFLDQGISQYIKDIKRVPEKPEKVTRHKNVAVELSLVRMPFPYPKPYIESEVVSKFASLLVSLMTSLTIFSVMQINSEKCSGFKELLRMHGISSKTQWIAWLLSNFLVYSIWTLLLSLLISLPIPGTQEQNLLSEGNISWILFWLLLLLFVMSITTFSYLVSVFFEKVWTAACVGLVIWIMLTIFMIVLGFDSFGNDGVLITSMLVPPVSLQYAFQLMFNNGATFETMTIPMLENEPVTLVHCLLMLALDNCIFMALAMYLDNVLPSKYGVRKSCLYFLWEFRNFLRRNISADLRYRKELTDELVDEDVEMMGTHSQDSRQPYEQIPRHVQAAVVVKNLRKVFKWNKKRAVDGLSVKMLTGEIFVLLGFNGAGKTTTIGLLTGLTDITDGNASVFDLDVKTEMEEIRKHIGLCPQHNLLSNEMTVLEQISFFGRLKGLNDYATKAADLLKLLNLSDKLSSKPEELSAGQMRRVQLAIALIGNTKLAFLDEPTSGLDPESRREVWKILLKLRGKVTIVLTTHTMEEADVLADRIGIMSEGKMMCCGTSSFLKEYYGVGYNLKIRPKNLQCDAKKLYCLTKNYIPNAKLGSVYENSLVSTSSTQADLISISLPTANLNLNQVANLMKVLNEKKEQLNIESTRLSMSSMEEVFLKVGEELNAVTTTSSTLTSPSTAASHNNIFSTNTFRLVGNKLQWYQYTTLLRKRMLYFFSAPFTLFSLMLSFSSVFCLALIWLSFTVYSPENTDSFVAVSSLDFYYRPVVLLLHVEDNNGSSNYKSSYLSQLSSFPPSDIKIETYSPNTTFEEIMHSLLQVEDSRYYRQHYIAGASFKQTWVQKNDSLIAATGLFSPFAVHSAPLSLNLMTQSLIKGMTDVDATISVINHPLRLPNKYSHLYPKWLTSLNNHDNLFLYFAKYGESMLFVIIVTLLTASAALLPTEERLNKGKQLQLMTGTTPLTYWMAMFSWDFIFFSLVNIVITAAFLLVDYLTGIWIFTNNGAGAVIYLILECHLFAALWFSYLVSTASCIKTASGGYITICVVALIVGILGHVIRHVLLDVSVHKDPSLKEDSARYMFSKGLHDFCIWFGYIASLVPMYSLLECKLKLSTISYRNSVCNWFPDDVLQWACNSNETIENSFLYSCCKNCDSETNCFKPEAYFNTASLTVLSPSHRKYLESHAMIFDLLLLILCGVICGGAVILMEYLTLVLARGRKHTGDSNTEEYDAGQDENVKTEGDLVNDVVQRYASERREFSTDHHALVAHNLHLKFGKLVAVQKGLSFAVRQGECFGLLGVNAAGKTSTFRMLTGDIQPSAGNMYCGGLNFYKNRFLYLSNIGYCPQFDAIIGALTGLQMVKLYGALRGIPKDQLDEHAKLWLDKFGLLGSANKKCADYSGGMKRRLSVAMALIGSPKVLLLDEPTTGVDPVWRRQFWNVIKQVRESGQSVVLTSHTMDECEALCSRLGIMVNGQLKCVDSIQNLKHEYGTGYILTVKLQRKVIEHDELEDDNKVGKLEEKITQEFVPCQLQSKQKFLIQYQIQNEALWYSDIFFGMERIRNLPEINQLVDEYSVTEVILEDVFLSLTRKETDGGEL